MDGNTLSEPSQLERAIRALYWARSTRSGRQLITNLRSWCEVHGIFALESALKQAFCSVNSVIIKMMIATPGALAREGHRSLSSKMAGAILGLTKEYLGPVGTDCKIFRVMKTFGDRAEEALHGKKPMTSFFQTEIEMQALTFQSLCTKPQQWRK